MSEKAANELVDIIRDIVLRELDKRDSTSLCQVIEQKDDIHFNVYVVPDEDTVIENVLNSSGLDVQVGDYVYIYKIGNKLNNSFIISKVAPYTGK